MSAESDHGSDVDPPPPKQKKTFTTWINNVLSRGKHHEGQAVNEVESDLCNGVKFIQLLEILTNQTFSYNKTPDNEEQKLENLTKFLGYMKDANVKIDNVPAIGKLRCIYNTCIMIASSLLLYYTIKQCIMFSIL